MNQSPRCAAFSASTLRLAFVSLLAAASIAAQSRIVKPTPQSNTSSGKRTHVATLRSSDSPEGSRVAISSDQSLNNYEAYRRGDRFYVKIPAADVPRAEAVRGRGFADVKAQRAGDSTVLSFRLQPGATAHVEQRANKLDVVVSVPGGGTPAVASNRSREVARPVAPSSNKGSNTNLREKSAANSVKSPPSNAGSNKNSGNQKSSPASGSSNSNSNKPGATFAPKATPTPVSTPSPKPSPTAKMATLTPAQKANANAASPSPATTAPATQARTDAWSRMKARANYWLLLAQLNPIPVVTGALILLAIIAALLFQRRRARATRRVKPAKTKSPKAKPADETGSESLANAAESSEPASAISEAAAANAAESVVAEVAEVAPIAVVKVPPASTNDDGRRERIAQVSNEAKKVFDGDRYDESIIGSDDPETRRVLGAELLSAMVGRNVERRARARAAFMKHGYFDDATRDLRVAQSENERAAAARRLSFVQDREATPHLVGALQDPAPDVRRAAVEALMDLRDPAAIAPLHSLMQSENDRKVPRAIIQQTIDACATSTPAERAPVVAGVAPSTEPTSQPFETEREVIEL